VVPLIADLPASEAGDGDVSQAEQTWLGDAIARLPARERTVITLGFLEERSGREIAEVLGVSESRVSQLRSRALTRLRFTRPTGEAR